MPPFVILALPRSRTAWLSHFLTYGPWVCGHEELRHMRSLEDAKSYLSMPFTGSAETALSPYWRTLLKLRPDVRVMVIRRDPEGPVQSFLKLPGTSWNEDALRAHMIRLDKKLDQVERRLPNVMSVPFEDLNNEEACARIFEFCLGMQHDSPRWQQLSQMNIQCNMPQIIRYFGAHMPQLERFSAQVRRDTLNDLTRKPHFETPEVTFKVEAFDTFYRDGKDAFERHAVLAGEHPDFHKGFNLDLYRQLEASGALQVLVARSNGRIFGYLLSVLSPAFNSTCELTASHTLFYADDSVPGLGRQLMNASKSHLRDRGVTQLFTRAGVKTEDGPRLRRLYERQGAIPQGEMFLHQL